MRQDEEEEMRHGIKGKEQRFCSLALGLDIKSENTPDPVIAVLSRALCLKTTYSLSLSKYENRLSCKNRRFIFVYFPKRYSPRCLQRMLFHRAVQRKLEICVQISLKTGAGGGAGGNGRHL